MWEKKMHHTQINFDFYTSGESYIEMVWVLYDPDTEYYMRRVIDIKTVKHKNLDKHIAKLIPSDLDEKYREMFSKAVKDNWFRMFHLHNDSPQNYAAQIPGLFVEVKHPVNGQRRTIHDIIIDLNDAHDWTREKIADWLETLDENPIITPQGDDDE